MKLLIFAFAAPITILVVLSVVVIVVISCSYLWDRIVTTRQKRNCFDCRWSNMAKSHVYIHCYHPETALNPNFHFTPTADISPNGNFLWFVDGKTKTIIHRCDCWKWDRSFHNLGLKGKAFLTYGHHKKPKKNI